MKNIILTVVMCFLSLTAYSAGTCQKQSEVCIDATPCRNVSGHNVCLSGHGGIDAGISCWKYLDTYNCVDANPINSCSAISNTPGCNLVSSVCDGTGFNGTCLSYTNQYKCGAGGAPVAPGVIDLGMSYSIVYDRIDTSPCASSASNPSCQLSAKTCVSGPATRNINGLDVYRECWEWKEEYNCVVSNPIDYCMPLIAVGCTKRSETCTETAFTGTCIKKDFTYMCGEQLSSPPSTVIQLNTSYTIVQDLLNNTQCQSYDNNPNCTVASQTCTEGPETRNINGMNVYRDCWKWSKDYTCSSLNLASTCGELINNPLCTEIGSSCIHYLPAGQCGLLEHEYKCAEGPSSVTSETNCSTQTFCVEGVCFDTGYSPDTDFGLVVAGMEALREAAEYGIFKGTEDECSRGYLGIKNCCAPSSGGASANNSEIANTVGSVAFQSAGQAVRVYGSTYLFEGLFNTASMMGSDVIESYAFSALSWGSAAPTVSVWGVEISYGISAAAEAEALLSGVAATPEFMFAFDPWSLAFAVAMYVITEMLACEEEDMLTGMKRGQGLCHHVGSYCNRKVLGSCVEKKETYCCFPSKLGKIINEQGRPQVGKTWGTAKHPDCSGFSLEQLSAINFSLIDFTEFIQTIPILNRNGAGAISSGVQKAGSGFSNPVHVGP